MGRDTAHYLLFLTQVATYKSASFYSGMHNWMRATKTDKHLSITIKVNIMESLPFAVSSMFLNDIIFDSDEISMLSHLLTHLIPSSSENLLLAISDLTCLRMGLGKTSID